MMEPYRPYVDLLVMNWLEQNPESEELTKDFKAYMLQIATKDVRIEDKTRPLLVAVKSTVISLYKCYTGEKRQIAYPELE